MSSLRNCTFVYGRTDRTLIQVKAGRCYLTRSCYCFSLPASAFWTWASANMFKQRHMRASSILFEHAAPVQIFRNKRISPIDVCQDVQTNASPSSVCFRNKRINVALGAACQKQTHQSVSCLNMQLPFILTDVNLHETAH